MCDGGGNHLAVLRNVKDKGLICDGLSSLNTRLGQSSGFNRCLEHLFWFLVFNIKVRGWKGRWRDVSNVGEPLGRAEESPSLYLFVTIYRYFHYFDFLFWTNRLPRFSNRQQWRFTPQNGTVKHLWAQQISRKRTSKLSSLNQRLIYYCKLRQFCLVVTD
jgi:hypothetical protein